ncbi:MAG: HD domain-containing protein [Acidobacteria bacterium]|nr:HD domain-containing protein [Acidobacteriota bacterium]
MQKIWDKLNQRLSRLLPRRIPLLYLILTVLLALSVIPLLVYGSRVSSRNREALQTNEQVLQNTVTRGIAEEIHLYLRSTNMQTASLIRWLESTRAIENVADPKHAESLRRATEGLVRAAENVLFLTVVNAEQRGIAGGDPEVGRDDFVIQRLGDGFRTAQLNNAFHSGTFLVTHGGRTEPVMVMAQPLATGTEFRGMVGTVISLEFLRERLIESSRGGLTTYVVDRNGRLIIYPEEKKYTVGQDMSHIEIVRIFLAGTEQASLTTPFTLIENGKDIEMLGTQVAVPELDWAVIAQKPVAQAYFAVYEMERYAFLLGLIAIALSVVVGYISARRLTTPLQVLAETTRAIAKGDFSRRVNLPSRTEIGELAATFNVMTDDLEKYVEQLKQAAQENHELFLGSIRTLAAAIDEKDPYTRGHSGRVAKYSVILAETLELPEDEVYKIRISALLHDVGKIGIDDRILKKPAGLTTEEFEIMKQHPVKGATIIRPVGKLREMIPGIELHHESLDGRGYPYGLKAEEIPTMARVIMVADTLDAMTTNRPYQVAMELEVAMEKIRAIAGKKFDPVVVDALFTAVEKGDLKLTPQMVEV